MKNHGSVKLTTPSDREIAMTRVFNAPRTLVFEAMTRPELIQRWLLGPDGWSMPVCEVDLRVGGKYRYVWRRDNDGTEMKMSGVFREIVPPERIVATEKFDDPWYPGEAVDTTVLVEKDGKTTMTLTMLLESKEARDGVLKSGMESGVNQSYDRLDDLLTDNSSTNKLTACLWFDDQAEEAARFYTSVFKNSKIGKISRYGKEGFEIHKRPAGTVMTIEFEINGQKFVGLNGGPIFKFNEAISFQVPCDTQEEIDYYWDNLSKGGDPKAQQCGWLKDRFGLSWQVVPKRLTQLLSNPDPQKAQRAMHTMLQMKKFDIRKLEEAAA